MTECCECGTDATLSGGGRCVTCETGDHLEILAELITTPARRFHCDYCSRFVRDDEVRHENGTAYHTCGVDAHRRSVPMGSKEA